ncbi:PIR Superfamily Protein [Plasmodium ovale curtisi]|uniref:PIR Superfamily Protein n=1 Tax=Plasmodium ovale curtisi TaxID=864141 RepID=A0A1A8XC52_PLAOA|nr:PIR Superfamily Protein [Plasmodium ovale curtisi]
MDDDYDNIFGLTSIRCYNQLDKDFVSSANYQECSKFNTDSDEYSEPYLLCLSLTGNLKNYKKLDFFKELNSHKCSYLNLWAYYRLSKLPVEEYNKMRKFIIDHWNLFEDYEKCSSTEFVLYLTSDTDYKKAKRLYDYSLNYYKLKELHYDNDISCTSKEQEYIRKSIELYQVIKAECEGINKEHISYCRAYKEIKKIHPNDILLELKCKKVEHGSETSRIDGIGLSGDLLGHGSQEVTETSSYGLHSTSGSHKAIGTPVPILGVLSIGFILHKFTGLGSMARNLLRGRINGMNSHDELPNELLESTYDDQVHPGVTETFIGYQGM